MARKIEAVTDGNVKAIDTLLEAENIRIFSKKVSDELHYLKYSSKKIKSSQLYKIRLHDFLEFAKNVPDAYNAKNKNTIRSRLNNQIVTKGTKC